jgi:hypothetical protein
MWAVRILGVGANVMCNKKLRLHPFGNTLVRHFQQNTKHPFQRVASHIRVLDLKSMEVKTLPLTKKSVQCSSLSGLVIEAFECGMSVHGMSIREPDRRRTS